MNSILTRTKLIVKQSPIHGYGVFADQTFLPGDIIEECVVLILPDPSPIILDDYLYRGKKGSVLPLGFGAIYNHSKQHNASVEHDEERRCTIFRAIKSIQAGEEIFITYGEDWFSARKLKLKQASLQFKLRKVISVIPSSVLRFILCLSAILLLGFVSI